MTRKKRSAGAPPTTREGACAPQAMKIVALGEELGVMFFGRQGQFLGGSRTRAPFYLRETAFKKRPLWCMIG